MSTTAPEPTTQYAAELGTVDKILPASARVWVYRVAIFLGGLIFVAAIILDATGHPVVAGVKVDPSTGVVALVLAALGALAHANLSSGPGILEAIESEVPVITTIVADAEKVVTEVETKVKAVETLDPDLDSMLKKDLQDIARKRGIPVSQTKPALIAAIKAATKKGA